MENVEIINGVTQASVLNTMSDELLQQLWEEGRLAGCDTRVKAQHQLSKWMGYYTTIGYSTFDHGAGLVKRINACRAKLVLLERQAVGDTQSTPPPRVCTQCPCHGHYGTALYVCVLHSH